MFDKLILDRDDTVLDVGCGEGSVTIPLAKRVKKVIGIDSSPKMLEYLEKRANDNNISNIETILKPIEEISYDEIGDVDVVVCSRSLNGIIPIREVLLELNKIARKYVFITIFGPENKKIEKDYYDTVEPLNDKELIMFGYSADCFGQMTLDFRVPIKKKLWGGKIEIAPEKIEYIWE